MLKQGLTMEPWLPGICQMTQANLEPVALLPLLTKYRNHLYLRHTLLGYDIYFKYGLCFWIVIFKWTKRKVEVYLLESIHSF